LLEEHEVLVTHSLSVVLIENVLIMNEDSISRSDRTSIFKLPPVLAFCNDTAVTNYQLVVIEHDLDLAAYRGVACLAVAGRGSSVDMTER
jgi:hypothetical protein